MIPTEVVETINDIRFMFISAQDALQEIPSFRSLVHSSTSLEARLADLARVLESPHLRQPCEGRITCAIIGSSGHGKTTILDEVFPTLSERGWLVTDVTDTTSQSLRISHAKVRSKALDEVVVNSWNVEQIKELMAHPEVEEQNAADGIRVAYLTDGVEVDGSGATFPEKDVGQFRFPRKIELKPFPEAYRVPEAEARDSKFIRALTVKEQSQLLESSDVIRMNGSAWNALQLRALVKDVSLKDPFERIKQWTGKDDEAVSKLTIVDTPGLATAGSVKDEVLRHFLEKKSNHIAHQLWKQDELDIVVHLALCGRQSDFAVLWKAIERDCGPAAMDDVADRLILAVNGMNIYFTNRDVKAKYEDPETAKREGDQFATTLEDNILQKMSPRGRVRPARICFLDSQSIVETLTGGSYENAYKMYRPVMEKWLESDGTGRATLERLGLLESFRENVDALCDPDDRGQGYLLRQITNLVEEKGPRLLLKKHVLNTGLLDGLDALDDALRGYYDGDGALNIEAVRAAMRSCLGFLDPDDLESVERFASEVLDDDIRALVPTDGTPVGPDWVAQAFQQLCDLLKNKILEHGEAPGEVFAEFARHFDTQCTQWGDRWGYAAADLVPPDKGFASSAELVSHCLGLHAREILYQLLVEDRDTEGAKLQQSEEDKEQMRNVLGMIGEGRRMAAAALEEHGVRS
ncbi:MAG: hypothetical protein CMJ83_08830 [Planctomycetes bacterium]|nr:hypothetical protein [Planctomycetota bacterium]